MNDYQLLQLDGVDQLRARSAEWDDLWLRSKITVPTAQAEPIARWVEQFATPDEFHALAVEDGAGRLLAALPVVYSRLADAIPIAAAVSNEWMPAGDLLLDESADVDAVLNSLLAAVAELPRQLLWLDEVEIDAPRWQAFAAAADRAGLTVEVTGQTEIARIEIDHDWDAYCKTWSKNHRKKMAKNGRRLTELGDLRLAVHSEIPAEQLEALLRRGFEVEKRSWKGDDGTSVLQTPGMFEFFLDQARFLARRGELEISLLESNERPIAFSFGMVAKGVHHSLKIGYDAEYATYGPGQLLRYFMLERFHADPGRLAMDCMGPATGSQLNWRPATYRAGRVAVAPRRLIGRALMHAYKHWWPSVSRFRGRTAANTA